MSTRTDVVRDCFRAYQTRNRDLLERCISDELVFSSPPDPQLDRGGYFERCWPNAQNLKSFEFVRVIENGNEVITTYECERSDGSKFRNTEVHTLNDQNRVARVEVYFGWEL
jgi:ketosteroid isomerase-like protein